MLDAAGYLDIDADGIREMPVDAPEEEEEAPIEAETIEELQEELEAMSTSLSEAMSQMTSQEGDCDRSILRYEKLKIIITLFFFPKALVNSY